MTEACHAQVRYDRQVSDDTAVKFMTDGILLRELQSDLLLRSYSVLVLDEAHERSLNTDLLLGTSCLDTLALCPCSHQLQGPVRL